MISIDKIIPGGQALGQLPNGKKAFFWNALPGEKVTDYLVTKEKSHFVECIATKFEHQSQHRIEPKDECFLSTSPWQIMDFDYENQLKTELVVEVFREHGMDIDPPKIYTDGIEYYYRNKMEYSLYWNHENSMIQLAFHQRGSHRKIPITKSSIERPEIFQAAKDIIDELNSRHEEARRYQSLLLRCNQKGQVSGGLYENHQPHPTFPRLKDAILGHEYSYSPNGFFQINLPVYETALQEIRQHITTQKVLDLYSGVGTIGLSVARDRELVLVECDKSAFSELETNILDINSEHPPVAVLAKSEDAISYIKHDQTVILDPPRAGCDQKLITRLLEERPPTIIYLSCNPATQARDIKALTSRYQIKQIETFNFFPRTPHIENLVVLSL